MFAFANALENGRHRNIQLDILGSVTGRKNLAKLRHISNHIHTEKGRWGGC